MNNSEAALLAAIDAHAPNIIALGTQILQNPELGYSEHNTAALVQKTLEGLGLSVQTGLAITGIKATLDTGRPGPTVAIMGELDAVISHAHPNANPTTGAAHACGHHAQVAAMLGVAMAFASTGIAQKELSGRICFIAPPAEEYGEIEKRLALRQAGKISWLGGKQELLAIGALDDVDMAIMIHASTDGPTAHITPRGMGFVGKSIRFIGKEAHAGGAPHEGINALNAATAALMLIHANRETFRDEDGVRIHPIITRGGDLVNVIPADVHMETYVRAWNLPAIQDASKKVDRALKGAAYAVGAQVEITDIPGYLPLASCPEMADIFAEALQNLPEIHTITRDSNFPGSTDMGDLSAVMPVIHPTIGGFCGAPHSCDYRTENETLAYITPAKALALTLHSLLKNNAEKAQNIKAAHPKTSYATYKANWDSLLKG